MSVASSVMNGETLQLYKGVGSSTTIESTAFVAAESDSACTRLLASLQRARMGEGLGEVRFIKDCRTSNGRTPVIVAAAAGNSYAINQLATAGFSISEVRVCKLLCHNLYHP